MLLVYAKNATNCSTVFIECQTYNNLQCFYWPKLKHVSFRPIEFWTGQHFIGGQMRIRVCTPIHCLLLIEFWPGQNSIDAKMCCLNWCPDRALTGSQRAPVAIWHCNKNQVLGQRIATYGAGISTVKRRTVWPGQTARRWVTSCDDGSECVTSSQRRTMWHIRR